MASHSSGGLVATSSAHALANDPIECWPKEKKLEKLANYSACQVTIND